MKNLLGAAVVVGVIWYYVHNKKKADALAAAASMAAAQAASAAAQSAQQDAGVTDDGSGQLGGQFEDDTEYGSQDSGDFGDDSGSQDGGGGGGSMPQGDQLGTGLPVGLPLPSPIIAPYVNARLSPAIQQAAPGVTTGGMTINPPTISGGITGAPLPAATPPAPLNTGSSTLGVLGLGSSPAPSPVIGGSSMTNVSPTSSGTQASMGMRKKAKPIVQKAVSNRTAQRPTLSRNFVDDDLPTDFEG